MTLDVSALRKAGRDFPPVKDRIVTLLRIDTRKITQAKSVSEKKILLRNLGADDTLIALWTGEWSTDAFQVSNDKLDEWKTAILD